MKFVSKFCFNVCLVVVLGLSLASCATMGNSLSKAGAGLVGGNYRVTLYSGGSAVRQWDLKGTVNEEDGSDGWYFNCKGQVVRISGDVVVENPSSIAALPSLIKCDKQISTPSSNLGEAAK